MDRKVYIPNVNKNVNKETWINGKARPRHVIRKAASQNMESTNNKSIETFIR